MVNLRLSSLFLQELLFGWLWLWPIAHSGPSVAMSKTLLLLKLLVGSDLRDRSLVAQMHPYATLSINQEIEVKSAIVRKGGRNPEWNQLFMLEVGPWWRGKELVLQVFSRNRMLSDSFVGGCSCKLGELVRACGLEDASSAPQHHSQPQPIGGAAAAIMAPTPAQCFERPTSKEVKGFGEILPILPQPDADDTEPGAATSSASAAPSPASSSSPSVAARMRRGSLMGSSSSSFSLPLTWLLLRHGGGPSKLKQFPLPNWSTPAGRVAVYLDFIVLPAPRIQPAPGLPSSILPSSWMTLADNEKLAWAARHRLERSRPLPAGGVVGLVTALGSAASNPLSLYGSPSAVPMSPSGQRYSIYGRNGASLGMGGSGGPPGSSAIVPPAAPAAWPMSLVQSALVAFRRSSVQDRIFYAYFFMLALTSVITELLFDPPASALGMSSSSGFGLGFYLPSWLPRVFPLLMGLLIFKLGWNMLHDQQLSHPWRRLDIVLTLILGVALGATSQIGALGGWRSRALGVLALSATHGYARAALYGPEVLAGVVAEQVRLAGVRSPAGSAAGADPRTVPLAHALLSWTFLSLVAAWRTGVKWVTGNLAGPRKQSIPGSIHLSLRSGFFLLGQVAAQWAFLDAPIVFTATTAADGDEQAEPIFTTAAVVGFLLPCFAYLLLFMFATGPAGREGGGAGHGQRAQPQPLSFLRGRPWLVLLSLNTVAFVYGSLHFLPLLVGVLASFAVRTIGAHIWPLLGLPLEYIAAAAFIPRSAFAAATQAAVPGAPRIQQEPPQMHENYMRHHNGNHQPLQQHLAPSSHQQQQEGQHRRSNSVAPPNIPAASRSRSGSAAVLQHPVG